MTPVARAVLLVAVLATSSATAQTGGAPVETAPVPLSADKQAIVREYVQRETVPEAQTGSPVTVGMTAPEGVELWTLPQDSMTEVPTVTSYRFFRSGDVIAVVEPESRKVIQIIQN